MEPVSAGSSDRAAEALRAPGSLRMLALVLLLLGGAATVPAPAAAKESETLKEWMYGPVRYLMTSSERRRFKGLETDRERADFVREFWKRRDPDPRTPTNEARLIFWERVVAANQKFGVPGKPGWRGDRGKVFIMLGPPEHVEEREDYSIGVNQLGRGILRWHYSGLRHARRANTIIAFTRGADEDWKLTEDPRLSSPWFDVNRDFREQSSSVLAAVAVPEGVPWAGSTLDTLMDLGRLLEGPTEAELLRAVVSAEGFLGTYAGALVVDIVPADSGAPVLALTTAVRRAEVYPPIPEGAAALASRFAASGQVTLPGGTPIEVPEEAFLAEPAPDPLDEWVRFQALVPLPPGTAGTCEIAAVILDRVGGGAATARATAGVAAAVPGAPRLTGPLLADRLTRTEDILPPATRPFRHGEALVTPRVTPTIGAAEPFAILLELHGDGAIALDWSFTRDGAPWGTPGRLDDARGIRAWEVKPGTMPPGSYVLTVTARGADGATTERTLSFTIDSKT